MSHALGTLRGKLALSLAALLMIAASVGLVVFSAFSSTQASSTNTFTAGTVALSTNGTGSVLFNMPNMKPGESASECVQVSYTGTLSAKMQVYGTQSGSLGHYLTVSILRGAFPGAAPAGNACTEFTPEAGGGSVWSGTLNELPTSSNPFSEAGEWTAGSVHTYKLTVTLPSNVSEEAAGKSAQASFAWQAYN